MTKPNTTSIKVGTGGKLPRLPKLNLHWRSKKFLGVATGLALLALAIVVAVVMRGRQPAPAIATQKVVDTAVSRTVINPDYTTATAELKQRLTQTSDKKARADIYVGLASIAGQQKQYDDVVSYLSEASRLDPSRSAGLSYNLAEAYNQIGQTAQARQNYEAAQRYYSSLPENTRGRSYYMADISAKLKALQK